MTSRLWCTAAYRDVGLHICALYAETLGHNMSLLTHYGGGGGGREIVGSGAQQQQNPWKGIHSPVSPQTNVLAQNSAPCCLLPRVDTHVMLGQLGRLSQEYVVRRP